MYPSFGNPPIRLLASMACISSVSILCHLSFGIYGIYPSLGNPFVSWHLWHLSFGICVSLWHLSFGIYPSASMPCIPRESIHSSPSSRHLWHLSFGIHLSLGPLFWAGLLKFLNYRTLFFFLYAPFDIFSQSVVLTKNKGKKFPFFLCGNLLEIYHGTNFPSCRTDCDFDRVAFISG